jgi:DNA-binding IclR family transcriptional regulator
MKQDRGAPIQSVDRALSLLEVVARSRVPIGASELARRTGVNRSTAWRLLETLEAHSLIDREPRGAGYVPGLGLLRLSTGAGHRALVRASRSVLQELARDTGETVILSVARGASLAVVDIIDSPQRISVDWWYQSQPPLHCASDGKLLLADFSEEHLATYLVRPLERRTPTTITDPEQLRAHLRAVAERGYATGVEELEEGLNGVSAAVRDCEDRIVSCVSVAAPAFRMPTNALPEVGRKLVDVADRLARLLA